MKILFVCTENAGRSQMAEGFLNSMTEKHKGMSAGTRPAKRVNSMTIEVMREVGIDISKHYSKPLTHELLRRADRVITMGCSAKEACPMGEDWDIEDPKDASLEKFRRIRDRIKAKVEALVKEIG